MLPLRTLAERHEVVAVVRASKPSGAFGTLSRVVVRALGLSRADALSHWAKARGVPCLEASSGADARVASRLRGLAPDLLCASAFRFVLAPALLSAGRRGALNLHPSLLPRHRGPVPWFWIYHSDDRATGLTVHWMDERADEGDILLQDSFGLPRGMGVDRLGAECARRGARLLLDAVERVEAGSADAEPQDGTRATAAPVVRRGSAMVDFGSWGAERVWHFLAGLCPRFREPLRDESGRRVEYGEVLGYELGAPGAPVGVVSRLERGLALNCRDGVVRLAAASLDRARP